MRGFSGTLLSDVLRHYTLPRVLAYPKVNFTLGQGAKMVANLHGTRSGLGSGTLIGGGLVQCLLPSEVCH
jgi:hypothetical protein